MTPFAAETTWVRDERGAEFWLIAIRACFEIDQQGHQSPAATQTEVQRAPVFAGDPLNSSLLKESDFALHKDGSDVLVEGRAYSPRNRPATSCSLRLRVDTIDKTVDVLGDRFIYYDMLGGLSITRPEPFLDMPLAWERTYGGLVRDGDKQECEPANPAGRGFAVQPSHLHGTMAPNFEYPGARYRRPGVGRPAAFGPVAPHWQPRMRYAGTYDKEWQQTRDPLVPADFDRRYFRCAPEDQQTRKTLTGHEQVTLEGFTPNGFLSFLLPRINFRIITTFRGFGDARQRPSIHTLWLMPDQRRFEIVYVSAQEVPPGREEKLVGTTVFIQKRVGTPVSILDTGVWSGD